MWRWLVACVVVAGMAGGGLSWEGRVFAGGSAGGSQSCSVKDTLCLGLIPPQGDEMPRLVASKVEMACAAGTTPQQQRSWCEFFCVTAGWGPDVTVTGGEVCTCRKPDGTVPECIPVGLAGGR